jgi:L-lysine exporter family protein LysE/ArgO
MSFGQGFMLGVGLCGSLGPQSIFVLRQGIRGEAAFGIATVCTLADFLLIAAAIAGADAIILGVPEVTSVGAWGGAAVALAFGGFTLSAALRCSRSSKPFMPGRSPTRAVIAAVVLSLLNPQVYLEMVVLVGGIALQFPREQRIAFAFGVALVSPVWFFGLAVGGRRLAGVLARPITLWALDIVAGLAMLMLGATIINGELGWL